MPRHLDIVVGKLAQLAVVAANGLVLCAHAEGQTGDKVHEEEDEAGEDERPAEGCADAGELVAELDVVAVDPADGVVFAAVETGNV